MVYLTAHALLQAGNHSMNNLLDRLEGATMPTGLEFNRHQTPSKTILFRVFPQLLCQTRPCVRAESAGPGFDGLHCQQARNGTDSWVACQCTTTIAQLRSWQTIQKPLTESIEPILSSSNIAVAPPSQSERRERNDIELSNCPFLWLDWPSFSE